MTRVDVPADLNSEDNTGLVWTFLDEADDPSIIKSGQLVAPGSPLAPAVCDLVDLVDKPAGTIVHLRVLPGTIEQYRRLLSRAGGLSFAPTRTPAQDWSPSEPVDDERDPDVLLRI